MKISPEDLLARGHVMAHVGRPTASDSTRAKIAGQLLSPASRQEGLRTTIAYYAVADCEWLARVARHLYLPSIVRNPRAMFPRSKSAFETARRNIGARRFELAIAFAETNPLQFIVFIAHPAVALRVYRTLRLNCRVPAKWSMAGGLPKENSLRSEVRP